MGLWLFGAVPLLGSFWINEVLSLVIQSGTCASCKHLFISSASLSWMEENFLNQDPCIPTWSGVFLFNISFSVFLSCSMCISTYGPSSSLSSSLLILFIQSAFSFMPFLVVIFSSKIVRFLWRPVVGMFLCHALPVVDRIFFCCFGMSCFVCIVLPFVVISLISLLSPELSGLFTQVVLLFFSRVIFSFLFPHIPGSFCFTILACFHRFFICVSSRISHPSFDYFFVRGSQFSHTLISPLQRLVHLTRLYYSLICKVVFDLFCSFLF